MHGHSTTPYEQQSTNNHNNNNNSSQIPVIAAAAQAILEQNNAAFATNTFYRYPQQQNPFHQAQSMVRQVTCFISHSSDIYLIVGISFPKRFLLTLDCSGTTTIVIISTL